MGDATLYATIGAALVATVTTLFALVMKKSADHHAGDVAQYKERLAEKVAYINKLEADLKNARDQAEELIEAVKKLVRAKMPKHESLAAPSVSSLSSAIYEMTGEVKMTPEEIRDIARKAR